MSDKPIKLTEGYLQKGFTPKVQGGYQGGGGAQPKPPTTGSLVKPPPEKK